MSRALVVVALGCLVAGMAAFSSCTKTSPVSASPNLAPETTLIARSEPAPGGGTQVLLQWLGSDKDGSVDHYLVRLDTLDWHKVTRTESVFAFPGPTKRPRLVHEEEERHSFAVKAVETFGGAGIESHVIDAFLNYNFHGRTCVLLSPTGTDRGNVCYMGFDLYYLKTYQVKTFFDELLPLFGETLVGEME
jgi:hypothetical protein